MNSFPKKKGLRIVEEDVGVPGLLLSLLSLLIKFLVPHASLQGFCFHKDDDSVGFSSVAWVH